MEWLAAMCSHVPNKGEKMVRYYGYYSNVSRGSRKKPNQDGLVPCIPQPDEPSRGYRKNWVRFTVYPPLTGPSDGFALVCDTLQQRISRQKHHQPTFDYDTDHSVQPVDVEIKISKAGSGFDPS